MEMRITKEQYEQLQDMALQRGITIDEAFYETMLLGLIIKKAGLEKIVEKNAKSMEEWQNKVKDRSGD